ncbi:MAG: GxxExxY protein, partial [Planctomycetota bacterium]
MRSAVGIERDALTGKIIGAAIEVHRELGPGLLESTYEECLCWELEQLKIPYQRQMVPAASIGAIEAMHGERVGGGSARWIGVDALNGLGRAEDSFGRV